MPRDPTRARSPKARSLRLCVDAPTATERRMAQLAAEGLSNRQIAQSLFVSVATVATHLTNAYQKLGIERREQLSEALGASNAL